jgi:rubrerythrin
VILRRAGGRIAPTCEAGPAAPARFGASLRTIERPVYSDGRRRPAPTLKEDDVSLKTIDEILDFAIANEEKAAAMYYDLADKVERPGMREAFLHFAKEEEGHKARLLKVKEGEIPAVAEERIADLGITEQLVDAEVAPNMTYQEALVFAMKAEKSAFTLYTRLAEMTDDSDLQKIFQGLAQEEAKHKLRFEMEYDDEVLDGV